MKNFEILILIDHLINNFKKSTFSDTRKLYFAMFIKFRKIIILIGIKNWIGDLMIQYKSTINK